jgi:polyphosphate glucokinase
MAGEGRRPHLRYRHRFNAEIAKQRGRTFLRCPVEALRAFDVDAAGVKDVTKREFESGPDLTPKTMVKKVKDLTKDWSYDVVSVRYPGPVVRDRPLTEPYNLGRGWAGFDFGKAFGRPAKVVNDALMQALGSYQGGKMLFLGLGTGLGSAMMELGHLPYR